MSEGNVSQPDLPGIQDGKVTLASFFERFIAYLLDQIFLFPLMGLIYYNYISLKFFMVYILVAMILFIYKPFMEYQYGATLGKMVMKLKVIGKDGHFIRFEQSMLRFVFFAMIYFVDAMNAFSIFQEDVFWEITDYTEEHLDLLLGLVQTYNEGFLKQLVTLFMMTSVFNIIFSSSKQAFHDVLAKTYVVKKEKVE